jgi:glyoxylase-like metal-dependent hydrolase (beta-lactamase superfamily II)/rhodanese-related sulfurtransferase
VIFETFTKEGCRSYLVGCEKTSAAMLVDPAIELGDRYEALAAARGLRIHYLLDTHTHADHFSASRRLGERLGAPTVMHRAAPAPFVDVRVEDGESLRVGELRVSILHTPGHTADSMCLVVEDRLISGDTLLLGSAGRTDLPTGDPAALYDSLHRRLAALDGALIVSPGHNYKGTPPRTLAEERATNPRLLAPSREAFVTEMRRLEMSLPTHLTEALRTNSTGASTVREILDDAARAVPFMSMQELVRRIESRERGLVIVDVREQHDFSSGRIPGAVHLPRGQLEMLVDERFPDPSVRILTYCELGRISILAAATLRRLGFHGAIALDGGMKAWRDAGHPVEVDTGL